MQARIDTSIWPCKDIALIGLMASLADIFSYHCLGYSEALIQSGIYETWLDSDGPRVISDMTERWANHYRASVHPLFPLLTYLPVYFFKKLFGVRLIKAAELTLTLVACCWALMLFVFLRLMRYRRFGSVILSLLAVTSAASVFWMTVPETYPLGSLTILLALTAVALEYYRKLSGIAHVLTIALMFAVTITQMGSLEFS